MELALESSINTTTTHLYMQSLKHAHIMFFWVIVSYYEQGSCGEKQNGGHVQDILL